MQVTQEVFDAFITKKAEHDEMLEFWNQIQRYIYRPGLFRFEANGEVFELNQGFDNPVAEGLVIPAYPSLQQEWPSWTQTEDGMWIAPVEKPQDENFYFWDEVEQSWHQIEAQAQDEEQ
jgi:hypothetical protein